MAFKIGDHILVDGVEGEIIAPPDSDNPCYTVHLWPGFQTCKRESDIKLDTRDIFYKERNVHVQR